MCYTEKAYYSENNTQDL